MVVDQDKLIQIASSIAARTCNELEVLPGMDDCAIVPIGSGELLGVTIDGINHKPLSMTLGIGEPADLGYLCAAANISDLLGSGMKPMIFVMWVGLPQDDALEQTINRVCEGAGEACSSGKVAYVGGDTKRAASLGLVGCAVGLSKEKSCRKRSGALVGDCVLLSGNVGMCAASTLMYGMRNALNEFGFVSREAILRPHLPWEAAAALQEFCEGHGGIDISDGLGKDIHSLLDMSEVGIELDGSALPVPREVEDAVREFSISPIDLAFGLAGDWQFVATCSPDEARAAMKSCSSLVKIGKIVSKESGRVLKIGKRRTELPKHGHVDFKSHSNFLEALKANLVLNS